MNRYIALQNIVEFNSFTKAAEALGYTQSAMSQMISSLEDELSIKLLHRSRVGVKLHFYYFDLFYIIDQQSFKNIIKIVNDVKREFHDIYPRLGVSGQTINKHKKTTYKLI